MRINANHPHAHPTHALKQKYMKLQGQYERLNAVQQSAEVSDRKRRLMTEMASLHVQIHTLSGQ